MSSYSPESAHHAVSEFLYSAIFLMCAQMMACDNDWSAVDRNLAEAVVLDCACFIFASCVCQHVLRFYLAPYVVC